MFKYTACISFKSFYVNQQVKAGKNHHLYVNVNIKLRCNGIVWLLEVLCSFIAEWVRVQSDRAWFCAFFLQSYNFPLNCVSIQINISCHIPYLIWEIVILWIWFSKILKCRLGIIVFRYFKLYILHKKALIVLTET